jgi:hypothetical protein
LQQFSNTTEATLNVVTATPTTPTAGTSKFYIKEIGGRTTFVTLDQFGETNQMQTALSFNNYSCVNYGLGAVPNVFGRAMTFLATVTHPSILATNLKTSINRYTHTSTATAGVVTGTRVTTVECLRGNAPKIGGFYVVSRFSLTTLQVGNRAFVGVSTAGATAPTNIDPTTSTTAAVIGMAINANTGNWNLVHNSVGVAPTVIALGTNFPVNNTDFLELIIYAPPNNANVYYRVKNLNTDNTTSGVISTNLPLNTAILGRTAWMTNNATAAAVAFDISKFSCETSY